METSGITFKTKGWINREAHTFNFLPRRFRLSDSRGPKIEPRPYLYSLGAFPVAPDPTSGYGLRECRAPAFKQ